MPAPVCHQQDTFCLVLAVYPHIPKNSHPDRPALPLEPHLGPHPQLCLCFEGDSQEEKSNLHPEETAEDSGWAGWVARGLQRDTVRDVLEAEESIQFSQDGTGLPISWGGHSGVSESCTKE